MTNDCKHSRSVDRVLAVETLVIGLLLVVSFVVIIAVRRLPAPYTVALVVEGDCRPYY